MVAHVQSASCLPVVNSGGVVWTGHFKVAPVRALGAGGRCSQGGDLLLWVAWQAVDLLPFEGGSEAVVSTFATSCKCHVLAGWPFWFHYQVEVTRRTTCVLRLHRAPARRQLPSRLSQPLQLCLQRVTR